VRQRIARAAIVATLFAATGAFAGDDFHLRFSPSIGAGLVYPRPSAGVSTSMGYAFLLDLAVEAGAWFFGGIALVHSSKDLPGVEPLLGDSGFLGGRLGYTLGGEIGSAYASVAAGWLLQEVVSGGPDPDSQSNRTGSGLGFGLELGAILFRRPGLGRLWIFGFTLLPTFDTAGSRIPSLGLGVRLGL